jgi:hypothetical protein
MKQEPVPLASHLVEADWVAFPGGELEGKRPKALCPACRAALKRESASKQRRPNGRPRPLCFQCYRAELERERGLQAAGHLHTASEARFQAQLPFEPVNHIRLEMLKAERTTSRTASVHGIGEYVNKRRQAQIAARRAAGDRRRVEDAQPAGGARSRRSGRGGACGRVAAARIVAAVCGRTLAARRRFAFHVGEG